MTATRTALSVTLTALALAFAACGKSEPAAAPTPAPAGDPKPTEPKPLANDPAKDPAPDPKPDPAADPTKAPEDKDPKTVEPGGDPSAVEEPGRIEPKVDPGIKSATALHPLTATPGTIIKDPHPESPEGIIQRALLAAMEPDEAKGWALFEALLHEDQKYGQALHYRREMNYPAMRRKVKLFLFEDETKPIYKISRILEDGNTIRIFVHNKQSMPTPCEVRLDTKTNLWKIGICSL